MPVSDLKLTIVPDINLNNSMQSSSGKVSFGYFGNWVIYPRKFPPSLIPVKDLTHLLYCFGKPVPNTGEVILSDAWADKDLLYPPDQVKVSGNLYGNLKEIYRLKKHNRNLKTLFSIGGWTYSDTERLFDPIVVSKTLRAKFVESSVKILEDYGFDGLDVDYEYPTTDEQAKGFLALLGDLRAALDAHARNKGIQYKFLLTIAAPCGPTKYELLPIAEMDKSLDFWNMMAYDFAVGAEKVANHQANLFGGTLSGSKAIEYYIKQGVPCSKLVFGIPLYGRSFADTEGLGKPCSGPGAGTWEPGAYDYRALPLPGTQTHVDKDAVAAWTYDNTKKELVSYDSEETALVKGEWIKKKELAGSMFWELSADKGTDRPGVPVVPQPGKSLVTIVKDAMGGLREDENWLEYKNSQYDNMRKGMPE